MENSNFKLNNEVDAGNNDPLFSSVIKTSLATFKYLFLFAVICITCLTMRFPYNAMSLYMDFSMHSIAFTHCKRAIKLYEKSNNNSMLVECLINGIELSDTLLIETSKTNYAHSLKEYTAKYALNSDFNQTNQTLDEFYLSSITLNSNITLKMSLNLFSFKNYVYTSNQKANKLLDINNEMLFNNEIRSITSITQNELTQLNTQNSIIDLAVFFNQSAFILNPHIAQLILSNSQILIEKAVNEIASNENSKIKGLFLLQSALNAYDNLLTYHSNLTEIETAFNYNQMTINQLFDYYLNQD